MRFASRQDVVERDDVVTVLFCTRSLIVAPFAPARPDLLDVGPCALAWLKVAHVCEQALGSVARDSFA